MSEVPLYLTHENTPPPQALTVGLRVGPYGGSGGGAFSCNRGTSVSSDIAQHWSADDALLPYSIRRILETAEGRI